MLESVFLIFIAMAFLLLVLGIELESIIYSSISTMMWVLIMISSLYVQVPGDTYYSEMGLNAFALMFIFTNIVWIISLHFDWRKKLP